MGLIHAVDPNTASTPSTVVVRVPGGRRLKAAAGTVSGGACSVLLLLGNTADAGEVGHHELASVVFADKGGRLAWSGDINVPSDMFLKLHVRLLGTGAAITVTGVIE